MRQTEDGAVNQSSTTEFLNDAVVKSAKRDLLVPIPKGLTDTSIISKQDTLQDFLAKPYRLTTVQWDTTFPAAQLLYDGVMPNAALANPLYQAKLKGFLGFKATTVVRIQVNATKFQQGRLIGVFIPQGGMNGVYSDMRTRSLTAMTALPRIELDVSEETEVMFEIPYVSPAPFYNLCNTDPVTIGRFRLFVYSPLKTGATGNHADISIWVHFKDAEMVTPTFNAQMEEPDIFDFESQSGRPRKQNVSEKESEEMGEKPVSGGLMKMASAAKSFAKMPLLSSVAGPAAWVLESLSGAASAFGYSKPTSASVMTKVHNVDQYFMTNCNGHDVAPSMSLDAAHKLSVLPGFAGTDVDEMALSHLMATPAFFSRAVWADTDAPGNTLFSCNVSPQDFKLALPTGGTVNGARYDHTPLSYFASFFQFWRGSIVITIKVVKSQFHSGRLRVTYAPSCFGSITLAQGNYCMREIIDVREASEYSFLLPFAATKQYLSSGPTNAFAGDPMGRFQIDVINELVHPDTASSTIDLLIEVAAGPDMEVMYPRVTSYAPYFDPAWSSQMDEPMLQNEVASETIVSEKPIGIAAEPVHSMDPAEYCVGEKCNSILQLLKRYSLVVDNTAPSVYSLNLRPFATVGFCGTENINEIRMTSDYLTMFATCFAYSRGSLRVGARFFNATITTPMFYPVEVTCFPDSELDVLLDQQIPRAPMRALQIVPSSTTNLTCIRVPPYQQYHCRLNRYSTTTYVEPADALTSNVRVAFRLVPDAPCKYDLFRSAADDYALGYFLGVPITEDIGAAIPTAY